jgi:hypothetical protein
METEKVKIRLNQGEIDILHEALRVYEAVLNAFQGVGGIGSLEGKDMEILDGAWDVLNAGGLKLRTKQAHRIVEEEADLFRGRKIKKENKEND